MDNGTKEGSRAKKRRLLEPVQPDGNSKFARALGSVDYHTREEGLRALTQWLCRRAVIEEDDLLKLWKGVFYCFWHSDKAPVQEALAERLSEIGTLVPQPVGELYYRTFLLTMRREWGGIDRLRLDKFMMLVRKFTAAALRQLQASGWDSERLGFYCGLWEREILLPPKDTPVRERSAGLAYHLADVMLPEMLRLAGEGGGALDGAAAIALLRPFVAAAATSREPPLLERLRQAVFDPLATEVGRPGERAPLRELDAAGLAAALFDLGAQEGVRVKNRELLYSCSRALEKAAAARQRQAGQQRRGVRADPAAAAAGAKRALAGASRPPPAAALAPEQQQQQQPASHKKGGKEKKRTREGQEQEPAAAAAAAAAAAPAAAPAAEPQAVPGTTSSGKKKKGQKQAQALPLPAFDLPAVVDEDDYPGPASGPAASTAPRPAPATAPRPVRAAAARTPVPAAAAGGASPSKKNVRFSLKRNLVMTIGQPPAPADVRTPPSSKPKGPALKKQSHLAPAEPPGSAPARLGAGKAGRQGSGGKAAAGGTKRRASLPSPATMPRARAAEFF